MDSADTVFSLAEELPAADGEGEGESENFAELQPGSIARGSLKETCFVRKITRLGAVLRVDSPRGLGERLELTLLTGERLAGAVSWVAAKELGLRFDAPADIFAVIARNLVRQPGDARRMPRVELRCPALLAAGSRHERVVIRNLSDGGARIDTHVPLVPHEQVVLTVDDFRPAGAEVRWAGGGAAGLAFTPTVPWQELMPWLRRRQPTARSATARTADSLATVDEPAAPPIAARDGEGIGLQLAARVREGTRRWKIEVAAIDAWQVRFISYAALEPGRLFWISLPGLEGWPARITEIDGYHVTCVFTQPLHPAVLERVLAQARA